MIPTSMEHSSSISPCLDVIRLGLDSSIAKVNPSNTMKIKITLIIETPDGELLADIKSGQFVNALATDVLMADEVIISSEHEVLTQ